MTTSTQQQSNRCDFMILWLHLSEDKAHFALKVFDKMYMYRYVISI